MVIICGAVEARKYLDFFFLFVDPFNQHQRHSHGNNFHFSILLFALDAFPCRIFQFKSFWCNQTPMQLILYTQ